MSRIGKNPIALTDKVTVAVADGQVTVKGPKGTLTHKLPGTITARLEGKLVLVERKGDDRVARSLHGLTRTLLQNMVLGVEKGFRKDLEIRGVGYRAAVKGKQLVLSLGYSHPIEFDIPEGITVTVADNVRLAIEGPDKHLVGQTAASIRAYKKPEPYKGKGVRYVGEYVIQKQGKTV